MEASKEMVVYCFDSIMTQLDKAYKPKLSPEKAKKWVEVKCPLFVTLKKGKGMSLRGCIGTFSNDMKLSEGLFSYARNSAFGDFRFSNVQLREMEEIHCGISLLIKFEPCKNIYDWEIGKHGIRIKFKDPGNQYQCGGTYLPEVAKEWKWNQKQTLTRLVKKAGYHGNFEENISYFEENMKVTRYQSSKAAMTFTEYKSYQ